METSDQYDVFLSHNSADKDAVEYLARRLQNEAGIRPYLDRWRLIPGDPWQEALEQALNKSSSVVVFLGPSGLGPWHNDEMRAALDLRIKGEALRVIPVLLPGSSIPEKGRMPLFLARRTWVDFRLGLDDADAFHRLVCGIRGVEPGSGFDFQGQYGDHPPYRGLQAFQPEDAAWFFGREAEVQQLVEKLRSTRFLAVLGASGSGKSSLILAGLIPCLRNGVLPESAGWKEIVFTPTAQPLEELAVRLGMLAPVSSPGEWLREIEKDPRSLHLAVRQTLADASAGQRVLVVVDQFEEIFTLCKNETARQMFFANLLYDCTVESGRTVTLVTMRADFLGKVAAYPELADRVSGFQFLITPLEKEQIRQVIERPAVQAGLEFERGLVSQILEDVSNQPGMLPLLEHALYELWKRRRDRTMTYSAYEEIEGVAGALVRTADATFASFTERQQELAQRILLKLVQPGEGTEDTRRRALRTELTTQDVPSEEVDYILTCLANERLITTGQAEKREEASVEVAHEALIHNWPQYRKWVESSRQALVFHRRLHEAAEEWQRLNRDEGLLFRGARLGQLREWTTDHAGDMDLVEQEFVDACEALSTREKEEEEAQHRLEMEAKAEKLRAEEQSRSASRLRRMAIRLSLAVLCLILALVAAGLFAVEARDQRNISQANYLAAQSQGNIEKQYDLALLLAVEAYKRNQTFTARNSLLSVLAYSPQMNRILYGLSEGVNDIAVDRSGKVLASGGDSGTIHLWEWAGDAFQLVGGPLKGHQDEIYDIVFSPDGRYLASVGKDRKVVLWNIAAALTSQLSASQPVSLTLPQDKNMQWLYSVAFSPDGKKLAAAGLGKYIFFWEDADRLWDDAGLRAKYRSFPNTKKNIYSLAFNQDGSYLVAGSGDSRLTVWDLTKIPGGEGGEAEPVNEVAANIGVIWSMDFHASETSASTPSTGKKSGDTLAIGSNSTVVQLYNFDEILTEKNPKRDNLNAHRSSVKNLAFIPGYPLLASASGDRSVILWNTSQYYPAAKLLGHQQGVGGVVFSQPCPEGGCQTLVSGGDDGLLIQWDLFPEWPQKQKLDSPNLSLKSAALSTDIQNLAGLDCPAKDSGTSCSLRFWEATKDNWKEISTPVSSHGALEDSVGLAYHRSMGLVATAGCNQGCQESEVSLFHIDDTNISPASFARVSGRVESLAISPDGKMLAAGTCSAQDENSFCLGGELYVWDIDSQKMIFLTNGSSPEKAEIRPFSSGVSSLAFHSNGKILLTGSCLKSGERLEKVGDTEVQVKYCLQGEIRRWELSGFRQEGTPLAAHLEVVTGLAFSNDGQTLASASCKQRNQDDQCVQSEIQLWDTTSWLPFGLPLSGYPASGPLRTMAFASDSLSLLGINGSGDLFQWDLDPLAWEKMICDRVGRNLSQTEWEQYLPGERYRQTCPQWEIGE